MGYYQKHISIPIVLSMLFFLNITASSQTTNWFSKGPYGGYVICVSVSKSNPNIVYIGTMQGVYKSENKGVSWIKTGFPDYEIRSIKVSPSSPDIVFAGTYEKGFWKTSDGGIEWVFAALGGETVNCITIDPNEPNKIYFGSGNQMKWGGCGIFRSTDGGETYSQILEWAPSGEAGLQQVNSIFIDPENSNFICAVGAPSSYDFSFGSFLYSNDGGTNWANKVFNPSGSDGILNVAFTIDTKGKKVAYVMERSVYNFGDNPKFYKTTDLGDNWEEVACPYTSTYDPDVFMIDPNNPNTIYTGVRSSDNQILTYKTDQDQWAVIPRTGLPSINSTCIGISTETNPTIYLGTSYGGIYNFTTGVSSYWTQIVRGLNATYISDIAVHPSSSDIAYACVKDEYGLFKTIDGGINWNWIKNSNPDLLAVDPQNPLILYAAQSRQQGSDYYIYKSTNSGITWQQINFIGCTGNDCSTLVTDILINPTNPKKILVATRPEWFTGYNAGPRGFGTVARTTDGGNNWDKLLSIESSALAIDPNNPDIIYSGKQRSGQIWKIENAWGARYATEITPSVGIDNITDIELDNSSNVYVSTVSGLWRYSADNWTVLTLPSKDITSLGIDRSLIPNVIYAGTGDKGVFISNDGGSTWHIWNNGLKKLAITKIRISGTKVWVGTEYGGAWCRNTAQSISLPYLTHNTGNYKMSIFQDGSFGHLSSLTTIGEGCQYKNNVDALYASGFIFGTQSAGFVNGNQASFGITNDFTNTEPIREVTSLDPKVDLISQAAYNDDGAIIPYGVTVNQKTYSDTGDEFVILEFGFTSASSSLDNFYAGIFADWDVGAGNGYSKNLGGYDQSRNLAYQYINDGSPDPNYYGVVALSGMAGAKVTVDTSNLPMRETALQRISTFENETITEIGDYRMWIGSGPFTLTQGNTKFVYFAFVAGTDSTNLQANADAAVQKYQHIITDVDENKVLPTQFNLSQNYPNPFNPSTLIKYQIPHGANVTLEIFDVLGRRVKVLVDEYKNAGNYKIEFNSKSLSSGTYFYRIRTGKFSDVKEMLLIK